MSEADSGSKHAQWTASWIEQQRETLRRQASAGASGDGKAHGPAEKWRELGDSYLKGLAELAGRSGGELAPFKVGEDLLASWHASVNAGAAIQQGVTRTIADALDQVPPLGLAREHAQAWRELLAAQAECQQLEQELRLVLLRVQNEALDLLEQRVREREAGGQPIASYRDLYNLWVECAEHVYSPVARSDAYSKLQAQLGNATMRLRARQQKIIEHALRQFDLPTRSEINSVHLQVRQLKSRLAALEQSASTPAKKPVVAGTRRKTRRATKSRGKKR